MKHVWVSGAYDNCDVQRTALLTAVFVGLVSSFLLPCSDTNLTRNDDCLSVTFEFANCPSLALLNIPTCNVTLIITNSTLTMWEFNTTSIGGTMSNVTISLEHSTVLRGLEVFPDTFVEFISNFSLRLSHCDVNVSTPFSARQTQRALIIINGAKLKLLVKLTIHLVRTVVALAVLDRQPSDDVNMGLFICATTSWWIQREAIASILSEIDMLVVDTTVISLWVGIESTQSNTVSFAPYDVVTHFIIFTGDPIDSLHDVSVRAVTSSFSGQGSMEATFFFVETINSTSGLDVSIVNCSFDFVMSGPTSSNAILRRSFVVNQQSPMEPSRITISNTLMRVAMVAGVAGELWNMSQVRSATSALVTVDLGNESTIQILINNCTCDVTITKGMFVPLTGSIQAAIVSVSTVGNNSSIVMHGLQLNVARSFLWFTIEAPICPSLRLFAVTAKNQARDSIAMTVQLSGIIAMTSVSLCILFTPVFNASIAIESSLVRASIPDVSQCAAVSSVAVLTPYANGAPQPFLQRTIIIGSAHVSSVASVLFVDEAAVGALVAAEVLSDPQLLSMVVSPGTPMSTVSGVDLSLCNCSVYSDLSRMPSLRVNTKMDSRALITFASVEMSDSTITVANTFNQFVPLFFASSSSMGRCNVAFINGSTSWRDHDTADDAAALPNLNWMTFLNVSMRSVRFNVSQVGPLSYSNASGALITIANSSIDVGSVLWGVSHAVVESVPPSFLLMDATGNNTYSSGAPGDHSVTVVALSCVTWNGVPAGMSLVGGVPNATYFFVLDRDCPPPTGNGLSSRSYARYAGGEVFSFALLSFGAATAVRTPTALVTSVAIRFSLAGRCDAVTFTDASDGNYFSLALGSEVPYYRGTVVGALIVLSGAAVLSAGLAAVMKAYLHVSWRAVLGALMLPSCTLCCSERCCLELGPA